MRPFAIFCLLFLQTFAFSQSITVSEETALIGLQKPRLFDNVILISPLSSLERTTVGLIEVKEGLPPLTIKVTNVNREIVPITAVDSKHYIVVASGKIWISVFGIDFAKQLVINEEHTFTISSPIPPQPDPDVPTPTPDVPADSFDNIGQRVASWTKGLPNNKAVGQVYADISDDLKTKPALTIDDSTAFITKNLSNIPNYKDTYVKFSTELNADIKKRWPMTKGVLIDYYRCVALGFGVKTKQ